MKKRLAAADGDDGGSHGPQAVDPLEHFFGRNGIRNVVEFVAIGAGQVAAPRGDDVRQQRMALGRESSHYHAYLADLAMRGQKFSSNCLACRHCFSTAKGGCALFLSPELPL